MGCSAAPLERTYCSVAGRRLAYAELGTGNPIVLLHGNPASS
jgi:haloalkane dehalogenase